MEITPWREIPEVTSVPSIWEDLYSVWTEEPIAIHDVASRRELKVFIFHPIHVFLNTDSADLYELTREVHRHPEELAKHRSDSPLGSESSLRALLDRCD
jgi:hypothetical protein